MRGHVYATKNSPFEDAFSYVAHALLSHRVTSAIYELILGAFSRTDEKKQRHLLFYLPIILLATKNCGLCNIFISKYSLFLICMSF